MSNVNERKEKVVYECVCVCVCVCVTDKLLTDKQAGRFNIGPQLSNGQDFVGRQQGNAVDEMFNEKVLKACEAKGCVTKKKKTHVMTALAYE